MVAGKLIASSQDSFSFFENDRVVAIEFTKGGADLIDVVEGGAIFASGRAVVPAIRI